MPPEAAAPEVAPRETASAERRPSRTVLGIFALTCFVVAAFALRDGLLAHGPRSPLFWVVSAGFALQLLGSTAFLLLCLRRGGAMRQTGEPGQP